MVKVGFIGLGSMGYQMAARLVEKGHDLVVYNRSRDKAVRFSREFGSEIAEKPLDVSRSCDIVHIMVSDDTAVLNVFVMSNGLVHGLSKNKVVVQQSTITPQVSTMLMDIAASKNAKYVEAPVIGSVSEARKGELVTYVGGNKEDVNIETIKALSKEVIYVGPVPQASALKLAVNNIFLATVASISESIALCEAYGIDAKKFFSIVKETTWMRSIIERYEDRGLNPNFPVRFKMELASKDSRYVANALEYVGIPSRVSAAVASLYTQASLSNYAFRDYSNILHYMREVGREARKLNI